MLQHGRDEEQHEQSGTAGCESSAEQEQCAPSFDRGPAVLGYGVLLDEALDDARRLRASADLFAAHRCPNPLIAQHLVVDPPADEGSGGEQCRHEDDDA